MAEETIHVPNSQDVNRSWRRISTGKLSFLYRQSNIVPNYLRSPTSSCHDVCKFGAKHESHDCNNKPRKVKRANRSFSETLKFDSSPLKKKALTKPVPNPVFGYGRYDSGGDDHGMSKARDFSRRVCDVNMKNAERTSSVKAVSLLSDSTRVKKNNKKKTVSHSYEEFGVSRGRELEIVEHNKRVTALKLKSVAQTAAKALRRSTVNRKKAIEPKKVGVPLRVSEYPKRCSRCLRTRKESDSLSVPVMKPRKMVDEKCKDLVEEKTLYVVKMETGNEIVESDMNQRCVVDSPIDDPSSSSLLKSRDEGEEFVNEIPEIEEEDNVSSQEEEEEEDHDENTTRKGKSKAEKSMKLGFKRGKVVEFGSQGNSPRKLKFKGRKLVDIAEKTSKTGVRRNLKSKGTNFSNDKEQEHKPKSLRVALKHQETEKKRDSRVLLFNNVIEETANKLVVTRKSKVKALVGAFESVISLQDKNSSTQQH
ncbi:unnamed protein product [Cochlearia groenlandica]